MIEKKRIDSLYGKILRMTFTDGAMTGKTYDHIFEVNGTVEFYAVDGVSKGESTFEKQSTVLKVAEKVFLVSYLGDSGYTLTVALNLENWRLVCIASNGKEWSQQNGTFEVLG
jgi:hypothetical protein